MSTHEFEICTRMKWADNPNHTLIPLGTVELPGEERGGLFEFAPGYELVVAEELRKIADVLAPRDPESNR